MMKKSDRVLATVVMGTLLLGLGTCSTGYLFFIRCPSPLPARVLYGDDMRQVETVAGPCIDAFQEDHGRWPTPDEVRLPTSGGAVYERDEATAAYRILLRRGADCGVTYDGAAGEWVLESGMRAPARKPETFDTAACAAVVQRE